MGPPGKWIKSLIGLKKPSYHESENGKVKVKKWKLWRSSSGGMTSGGKDRMSAGYATETEGSEASFAHGEMAAAMAALAKASPKDFLAIRREWAAVRIQAFFRAFLARRALRALKALVRLQAIVRGRSVRKKAAVTLRCMQALARVQARVRAQVTQPSSEEQRENETRFDPLILAESGWCNIPGTVEEVKERLQMKREGVVKRERASAYAFSQQLRNVPNKNGMGHEWLESWMATKPWDSTEITPTSFKVSAKSCQISRACSDSFLESGYDETTTSTSSATITTPSPGSGESTGTKPNYMNPTKSVQAKQRSSSSTNNATSSSSLQRHSVEELHYHRKPSPLSRDCTKGRRSADTTNPIQYRHYR